MTRRTFATTTTATAAAALGILVLASFAPADAPAGGAASQNWPRWRGPDGTGHSSDADAPVKWDASSVVWKTPLKGRGQSSPIVWGDRVFLTSAVDDGRQRLVICVDRRDGKVAWEQIAWTGEPEPTHEMNGWASASCCTDGERVYASFGRGGMHCYTVDGKHVWSRDLGKFLSSNKRGTAASPVLWGKLVILNGDSESDPYVFGLDKLTGETVWKTDRPRDEGYSTPVLIEEAGHPELVLNGPAFVAGYDPATGKELWRCKSFAGRGEPTPAVGKDAIYVVNGLPGDVYAVRPGGQGDVTGSRMLWHTPRRNGRDGPSPILVGDYLLVSNMQGIANVYDAKTGKELWKGRIGTGQITASPIAVGNRVYFLFETGEAVVLDPPGPEPKVIARNALDHEPGEIFRATPTPVGGRMLIRSDRALYCVGGGK
jgi:outer membrane protein assembly factor BamB